MATSPSLVVLMAVSKELACCFTGKVFPLPLPTTWKIGHWY